jgi:hypothetical protein
MFKLSCCTFVTFRPISNSSIQERDKGLIFYRHFDERLKGGIPNLTLRGARRPKLSAHEVSRFPISSLLPQQLFEGGACCCPRRRRASHRHRFSDCVLLACHHYYTFATVFTLQAFAIARRLWACVSLAPHTNGRRGVPRCGALSLLQKLPPRGVQ